jgi:hypothetical protein
MRGRGAVAAILSSILAAAVAGCNVLEGQFFREGIGSELYGGSETVTATEYQDAYLGLICRQAGLPSIINADGTAYCDQSADWSLVVQAGMNDIDRRCDGYLAWLDDKRRSSEPLLKELAAVGASTLGVLDATSAGVKAITITGIAFGLAANTFMNVNSRLLSLEQSTIQAIVLDSQQKFRENNKTTIINNRPAAVYHLRRYLRICLPFSIETTVNNTVTVFHNAGPDALSDNTIFTRKLITDPNERRGLPPKPRPNPAEDRLNAYERGPEITTDYIMKIQRTLCVTPVDGRLGQRGSATRNAIAEFLVGRGRTAVEELSAIRKAFLDAAIARFPSCPGMTPRAIGEAIKPQTKQ